MVSCVGEVIAQNSPLSTAGVNIYKETDDKCQAIELLNSLHKLKICACRIQIQGHNSGYYIFYN
jgi:hypothetical protein